MLPKLIQSPYPFWLWLCRVVLVSSLTAGSLRAQTINPTQIPNPVTPIPSTTPTPFVPPTPSPLPSPQEPLQPSSPTPQLPEELPNNIADTISVERFEVVGSTVFSPERLEEVTHRFTGQRVTFTQLLQARSAVTQLYHESGYTTSGAFIPAQKLQGGIVEIRVIEGQLEDIQVKGNQRLNPEYVRSRLALSTSTPLNKNHLEEALRLLRLNPLIENLSAELSAGSGPGRSLLEVRVTEAKTFNAQVAIDNGRSPSVGSFRRRLQLSEANLLGQGDGLSVGYTNTNGSNGLDVSYTLPINPRDGILRLSYGTTLSHVIEPPFDKLDINANSRYYELTLRQPVIQTATQESTQEFALGLTASRLESDTSLLEIPFPLSAGADDKGRTHISALRFFQEWTRRSNQEVIAVRSQFSLGIGVFNATINEAAPDSRFFSWRGQAQWARRLAPETLLLVRADMQMADRALVPLEQFALGGLGSVRGYRQDILLTDDGALAAAELRLPVYRTFDRQGILQIIPFIDVGTTWNSSGKANPDPNTLAAVGLGLQWQQGDRFTARLDWGIPLISVRSQGNTWQENGLYFSVQYNYNPF